MKGLLIDSSATSIKVFLALDLWKKFQMVDLPEVMRHRGDSEMHCFPIKKVSEGNINENVEHTLKLHF